MPCDAKPKMPDPGTPKGERVAKLMARAGLCSRRDAERWIAERRVQVDGIVIDTPAVTVDDPARIQVDGKALPARETVRLWRYHKPPGLVTTHKDDQGRPTVFDHLPAGLPRVVSVGRLDLNSEGLLLLTNDGALARQLELPSNGWERTYRVRVFGHVTQDMLDGLKGGVEADGVRYGPIAARIEKASGRNAWLIITLREGKNREIRNVCRHLGLEVNRLIRQAYGPFRLDDLARGEAREVSKRHLIDQLGGMLQESGAEAQAKIDKTGWAKAKPKPKGKGKGKPKPKAKPKSRPPQHVRKRTR